MYKNRIRERKVSFIANVKSESMRKARSLIGILLLSKNRKKISNILYSMQHARHVPCNQREHTRVHESIYSVEWRDSGFRKHYCRNCA